MFDDLIDIFSLHKLFLPLTALVQDLSNGPACVLSISIFSATRREVRSYLEANGIAIWGELYDNGQYTFRVRQDQAERAHELLRQRGWIK